MSSIRSSFIRVVASGIFVIFLAVSASAQFRAGLEGSVTDAQGGAVVGATVTLTNKETTKSQQTITSGEGFYRFSQLPPGNYSLSAELAGFKKEMIDTLVINAEETQGRNITLQAGGVSETVTITDTQTQTLQTENANIDKSVSTQEIRELPQNNRDPYELTRLTPGVFGDFARGGDGNAVNLPNQQGPGGTRGDRGIFQVENQPQISANGQRVSANDYQIDGTSVNSLEQGGSAVITPNQESVKEVRVIANSYSAEFGRNTGAQVLTVSQNGTDQFHGSLFLKHNEPGFNSFNKYGGLNSAPPVRNNQHYNQFGGSFGGPIPLPRFGEGAPPAFKLLRNKAFFFFSYEALRNSSVSFSNQYVETPQYRATILGYAPGSVTAQILGASGIAPRISSVLPITCAQAGFPNGQYPNCQVVGGGIDIGSPAGGSGNYLPFSKLFGGGLDGIPDIQFAQIAAPERSRGNQFNVRTDFNLTPKDTLTFSSYYSLFNAVQSQTADGRGARPMDDITTSPHNIYGTLAYTRILSPTTVNEARINATRLHFNEVESSNSTNFGIPNIKIEDLPHQIFFGPEFSETTPGIFSENTFEFRDTLRKARGSHALSFGGEYRKEQDNNNLIGGARPLFSFAGPFNFANNAPLFYQINTDPRTGGPPDSQRYFRTHTVSFFAQDDWKFRPNLTLNFGLRYEYFSPLTEKKGRLTNLILGSGPNALVNATIQTVHDLYPPERKNFAPRVGFAYSPNKIIGMNTTNKLVIRGGFGIAYNRIPNELFANTRGNPPFLARYGICCGTSAQDFSTPFDNGLILYALGANNTPTSFPVNPALKLAFNPTTGIPITANGAQVEIYGAPTRVKTPYVYLYSLNLQYELPAKMTAEASYQGSASRHLVRIVNQRFIFKDPGTFSGVFFPTSDTTASYNAMILRLSRRFSKGLSFDMNYRFSKSIDEVSSEQVGAGTNPTYPVDIRQERGPSDFDVKHAFVSSVVWDLPLFRKRTDLAGKVLGGWQISGIGTLHSGFPWTPVTGQCSSTLGPSQCPARPVAYFGGAGNDSSNNAFITGSNFPGGGGKFFDITTNPGLRLPGIGRNSFRGPHYRDVDLTLAKRFGLTERANFEIKANFFNVFNILNLQPFGFDTDSTHADRPSFGKATGALSGRVVEFQGRISF